MNNSDVDSFSYLRKYLYILDGIIILFYAMKN